MGSREAVWTCFGAIRYLVRIAQACLAAHARAAEALGLLQLAATLQRLVAQPGLELQQAAALLAPPLGAALFPRCTCNESNPIGSETKQGVFALRLVTWR